MRNNTLHSLFLISAASLLVAFSRPASAYYDLWKGPGISGSGPGNYTYSRLQVGRDGFLYDETGTNRVYLKGFNTAGFFLANASGTRTESDTKFLYDNYRMNFVRLTIQARWYNTNVFVPDAGMYYRDWIKTNIDWFTKYGFYILITKGPTYYAPPCTQTGVPGYPTFCPSQNEGQNEPQPDAKAADMNYTDCAFDFFRNIVPVFKNYNNVLYDTWNEPHESDNWPLWFNVESQVIDIIRSNALNAVIVVEGPNTGGKIRDALTSLKKDFSQPNLIYSAHIYDGFNGISPATGKSCSEPGSYPWGGPADVISNVTWAHSLGRGYAVTEWGGCYDYEPYHTDMINLGKNQGVALAYWQSGDCTGISGSSQALNANGLLVQASYYSYPALPTLTMVDPATSLVHVGGTNAPVQFSVAVNNWPAGLPQTNQWSLLSGPGKISFSSPNALSTLATFSAVGMYRVGFSVNNGAMPGLYWTVVVNPAGGLLLFEDTFEDGHGGPATPNDDIGPNYGLDIQWDSHSTTENGYNVVLDPVYGSYALRFTNGTGTAGNNKRLIAQFDNDDSDDITFGGSSVPASLGTNVNDAMELCLRIRVDSPIVTPLGNKIFLCGLMYLPPGPTNAPQTSNGGLCDDPSWIRPGVGYFFGIKETTAARCGTWKQLGTNAVGYDVTKQTYDPFDTQSGAVSSANLSPGIPSVNVAFGTDTKAHSILMRFTRLAAGIIRIDSYWDDLLVSTATDDGHTGGVAPLGPLTSFNTFMIRYGTGGGRGYIVDDVKLAVTAATLVAPGLSAWLADTNLTLNATGGTPGARAWLLMSTNVTQPMSGWAAVSTNVLDGAGGLNLITNIDSTVPQRFYRIQIPGP